MKKLIAFMLILMLTVFSLNITVAFAAPSANLLVNSGFESGITGWTCNDTFTFVNDSHSGNYALKVTKSDTRTYYKLYQFPLSAMETTGDGMYKASCYVKGDSGRISLVVKLYSKNGSDYYAQTSYVNLTSDYSYIETTFLFYKSYGCTDAEFYFQTGDTTSNEVIIDDCCLVLDKADSDFSTPNNNISASEKTQIGAIRWDAYYKTSQYPQSYTSADQVARTLTNYQDQAPYFSKYRGIAYDVRIKFISSYEKYGTSYTIDDVESDTLAEKTIKYDYGTPWETESAYAYNASIDYFAYLWYKTTDNMSLPRKAHVAKNGYINETDQMKMCAILSSDTEKAADLSLYSTKAQKINAISVTHRELYQAMASSCYLTVKCGTDKIPILYFYQGNSFITPTELSRIKAEAVFYTAYLAEMNPAKYTAVTDIYTVTMGAAYATDDFVLTSRYIGFDAVSGYAITHKITESEKSSANVQSEAMTRYGYSDLTRANGTSGTCYSIDYGTLVQDNQQAISNYAEYASEISSIPLVSAGYCCVPRIKVQVTWTGDYSWQYVRKGSASEIAENLRQSLQWIKDNPDSDKANCVLLYAWNEHDEGGYLCPTAKVDSNNNIIYDSNGNAQADTTVLDAVKAVIGEFKNDTTVTVKSQNADFGATAKVTYTYLGEEHEYNTSFPDEMKIENLPDCQLITLTATGDNFVGWYRTKDKKNYFISGNMQAQFVTKEQNETFVAVYKDNNDLTITFKNANGNIISKQNIADLTADTIPNMENYMPGVAFAGWSVDGQLKSASQLLAYVSTVEYSITASAKYNISDKVTLNINGEVKCQVNGEYDKLSLITVEAKETDSSNRAFGYWKYTDSDGDHILSTKQKYSFYITADTVLTAVYGESEDTQAEITVTSIESVDDKLIATVQRFVDSDYTVVEHGILLTKDDTIESNDFKFCSDALNNGSVICARSSGKANNGLLIVTKLNVKSDENWRFRGYVVYCDQNGNIYTKYSAIKSAN